MENVESSMLEASPSSWISFQHSITGGPLLKKESHGSHLAIAASWIPTHKRTFFLARLSVVWLKLYIQHSFFLKLPMGQCWKLFWEANFFSFSGIGQSFKIFWRTSFRDLGGKAQIYSLKKFPGLPRATMVSKKKILSAPPLSHSEERMRDAWLRIGCCYCSAVVASSLSGWNFVPLNLPLLVVL